MSRRQNIVRKTDLRRAIDTLRERGVPLGSLELLPGGEVRLNLATPNQATAVDFETEIRSWDEALG
jgi:hypothetical protein